MKTLFKGKWHVRNPFGTITWSLKVAVGKNYIMFDQTVLDGEEVFQCSLNKDKIIEDGWLDEEFFKAGIAKGKDWKE